MIKKQLVIWLSVILTIFSLSACIIPDAPNNTPQQTPSEEALLNIYSLSKYTIVYPESYNEYQKESVYILRDAIKRITGVQIPLITDSQPYTEYEIILASSNRVTSLRKNIEALEGSMDYIIAISNGDIILGGKSYYGDIRAIYDFVNNYIGYNDVSNKLIAGEKTLIGISKNTYTEPTFTINAVSYESAPFFNAVQLSALKSAGFNTVTVDSNMYTEKQMHEFITQCTRFGIQIIFRGTDHMSVYKDCPVIKGHFIVDEPYGEDAYEYYSELCKQYSEAYSQYGWQPYVNIMGQLDVMKYLSESEYFADVNTLAFYGKLFGTAKNQDYIFREYEVLARQAHLEGKQLWGYIQSEDLDGISVDKAFRWMAYVAMCFGANGIQYFNYSPPQNNDQTSDTSGWIADNSNLPANAYESASNVNENILALAGLYCRYDYLGTLTVQGTNAPEYTYLEQSYNGFSDKLTDFVSEDESKSYIIGCFRSNNFDGGYALMLMDTEMPNDITYGSDKSSTIKFKLNSSVSSILCYIDSDEFIIEKDADGYFSVTLQSSQSLFVTFK